MIKKIAIALTAIILLFILSGCSGSPDAPARGDTGWYASEVTLPDKTTVMCVATSGGGVTCDWNKRSVR